MWFNATNLDEFKQILSVSGTTAFKLESKASAYCEQHRCPVNNQIQMTLLMNKIHLLQRGKVSYIQLLTHHSREKE